MRSGWLRQIDFDGFCDDYPDMRVGVGSTDGLVLEGVFGFAAACKGSEIEDSYALTIEVPGAFPRELPEVRETDNRIPPSFHTNPDGTLCLGSPLRLLRKVAGKPTLSGYAELCLVPFVYAYSFKSRYGRLPWSDLPHGDAGLLHDYRTMFGTRDENVVVALLDLLGTPTVIAEHKRCPCSSGRRYRECHARTLTPYRGLWSEERFREERDKMRKFIDWKRAVLEQAVRFAVSRTRGPR